MAKDLKLVGLMAAAVIAAGYIMYALRDVDVIAQARNGFDTGIV